MGAGNRSARRESRAMTYFLGVDGGGTKTLAVIIDAEGMERGRGAGGPGNIAVHPDATLTDSLRTAVNGALIAANLPPATRFAGVCAGMAGWSAAGRRADFETILRREVSAERYAVEPDYVIAWWGATEGEPGVIVIAGTGSVCYGRNAQGRTHIEDGLGYLLGDRGSGYQMGLQAVKIIVKSLRRAWDMTNPKYANIQPLRDAVFTHIGGQTIEDLLQWLYIDFSPAKVASLAPVVGALANAGDSWACGMVHTSAFSLRSSVSATLHYLELPQETPIYPLGGLWNIGPLFREYFAHPRVLYCPDPTPFLPGKGPAPFTLAEPRHAAANGAALLARYSANL